MTLTRRKSDSDRISTDHSAILLMSKLPISQNRLLANSPSRRRRGLLLIFLVCLGFLFGFVLIYTQFFDENAMKIRMTEDPQPIDISDSLQEPISHRKFQTDHLQSYQYRLQELSQIKSSVLRELRSLEQKRHQLRSEITTITAKLESYQSAFERKEKELDQLKSSIEQAKLTKQEALEQDTPVISAPKSFIAEVRKPVSVLAQPSIETAQHCTMESCFDHSRCSILSKFPVFVHERFLGDLRVNDSAEFILHSDYTTDHMEMSCAFLVPFWMSSVKSSSQLKTQLIQLPSWGGDGRNHILVPLLDEDISMADFDKIFYSSPSRAVIVTPFADSKIFRNNFDLVTFPFYWQNRTLPLDGMFLPPISPARRKFLLSFWAEPICQNEEVTELTKSLRDMQLVGQKTKDKFYFSFSCSDVANSSNLEPTGTAAINYDCWTQCDSPTRRADLLKDSTFTLISVSRGTVSQSVLDRLAEALQFGSIPVILGDKSVEYRLPYWEIFDWKTVGVFLPAVRLTETHFLLRTFVDANLIQFRSNGRRAYELFLSSNARILETLLAVLRTRLSIPPLVAKDFTAISVFNDTFRPKTTEMPYLSETDEFLGPVELPYDSHRFVANFSAVTYQVYETWNSAPYPFALFPHNPIAEKLLPSEAKFTGIDYS